MSTRTDNTWVGALDRALDAMTLEEVNDRLDQLEETLKRQRIIMEHIVGVLESRNGIRRPPRHLNRVTSTLLTHPPAKR